MSAEIERDTERPRLVVGIGASAGGLAACKKFLAAMPPQSGIAVVVIMHLDPSRESHIVEIFKTATDLDVVQVSAPTRVQPDCVYVIAPDSSLEIRDGVLNPNKPHDPHGHRHPVDALLSSLAQDQKTLAVGIILSGTGNNGSAGLRDIKALGGMCLVQDPGTAEYDGMPQNAIATGTADYVLPPEEMPQILLEHAEHPGDPSVADNAEHAALDAILDLLSRSYKVNFRSSYKRGTLYRRTARRIGLRQLSNLPEYLEVLRNDPKEVAALYSDLLIGVTQFFRDPEVWEDLKTEILPKILAQQRADEPLKFWVSGCATGEEAYTLAIAVVEQLELAGRSAKVQIFATDIAENALAYARRGMYPFSIKESLSPLRLGRFFRQEGSGFQIVQEVRDMVTFAVHNLLSDPPFSRIDLATCRNVLIYLESHAQQRVLELFHFALRPGGLLLLGKSETIGQHQGLFDVVSPKTRLFRSAAVTEAARHQHLKWATAERAFHGERVLSATNPLPPRGLQISRIVEQIVLSRYTWACVAVSESFAIQSFWGPTHEYLTQPTGEARMDLLSWVKPGIYPRLRTALERARESKQRVTATDMRIEHDGITRRVECTVEPVTPLPGEARLFLVSFRDAPSPTGVERNESVESGDLLVRQLEGENKDLRDELQRTVEQLESTNEEYRASHEELLSLNEELQSNNEELQASKEELQSLNEEMVTVNRQLEDRNAELHAVSTDLKNLLMSTDIPIIFLDRELRVRRFMPAATQLMRLVPSDIGRSIEHIKERFHDAGLVSDAKVVLDKLVPITAEVQTEDGRWFARVMRPYRTEDDRIDGVCIAFFEVTEQKTAVAQHEESRRSVERLVAESPAALLVLDADMRIVTASNAFCKMFMVSKGETEGIRFFDLGNRQWDIPRLRALLEKILPEKAEVRDYEVTNDFEHLGPRAMRLQGRRLSRGDQPAYIVVSFEDLTERKAIEDALKTRADELSEEHQRRNEFLAMLGHELRNPLAALMHGLDLLGLAGEDSARREQIRGMMARQARRIGYMLDQLLDVARLTTGKIEMARAPVDLKEATQAAIETVTPLIESRSHRLTVSLSPEKMAVQGDLARLTQVVENLLSNSAKYMDEAGDIVLTLGPDKSDDSRIRLSVKDTGIGMDADLIPHIFELFTQGPRALDRSAGGLGLGLPLVKRVVEMHGGSVEASSRGRGHGSEFVIMLPRLRERRSPGRTSQIDDDKQLGSSLRILVVDDEQDNANAMAELLTSEGHEPLAVFDGPAALQAARTFRPDVVLLDLGLPGMDGYEVAKQLREQHRGENIFLVAVTGYQGDKGRLQQAGFDWHMMKPPHMQKLISRLAAWDREQRGAGGHRSSDESS